MIDLLFAFLTAYVNNLFKATKKLLEILTSCRFWSLFFECIFLASPQLFICMLQSKEIIENAPPEAKEKLLKISVVNLVDLINNAGPKTFWTGFLYLIVFITRIMVTRRDTRECNTGLIVFAYIFCSFSLLGNLVFGTWKWQTCAENCLTFAYVFAQLKTAPFFGPLGVVSDFVCMVIGSYLAIVTTDMGNTSINFRVWIMVPFALTLASYKSRERLIFKVIIDDGGDNRDVLPR